MPAANGSGSATVFTVDGRISHFQENSIANAGTIDQRASILVNGALAGAALLTFPE
jgi:hypothetical protein